ncbi:hypothetical protein [Spirosoma endbachense]|uniref:Uncharacterized protein n=1 Tax=Spirosoma endbachense TaxID=2666025 RepID=A0A6P1W3X2_9BACT|nr:hypothetical protein [Spirosoma endbachense]QHV99248.1 hypothetical protein GJR95_31415 [Spirosoma endbachense]
MTKKQAEQFNKMRAALLRISKMYQTPAQLRKSSKSQFGLDYEEALEMTYENLQSEAAAAVKGVKEVQP